MSQLIYQNTKYTLIHNVGNITMCECDVIKTDFEYFAIFRERPDNPGRSVTNCIEDLATDLYKKQIITKPECTSFIEMVGKEPEEMALDWVSLEFDKGVFSNPKWERTTLGDLFSKIGSYNEATTPPREIKILEQKFTFTPGKDTIDESLGLKPDIMDEVSCYLNTYRNNLNLIVDLLDDNRIDVLIILASITLRPEVLRVLNKIYPDKEKE